MSTRAHAQPFRTVSLLEGYGIPLPAGGSGPRFWASLRIPRYTALGAFFFGFLVVFSPLFSRLGHPISSFFFSGRPRFRIPPIPICFLPPHPRSAAFPSRYCGTSPRKRVYTFHDDAKIFPLLPSMSSLRPPQCFPSFVFGIRRSRSWTQFLRGWKFLLSSQG